MNKRIGIAIGLLVVVIVGGWWWRQHRAAPVSRPVAAAGSGSNIATAPGATTTTDSAPALARIMGRVVDEANHPISDAVVVARSTGNDESVTATTTAADGSFLLADISVGTVSVTASAKEFEPNTNLDVSLRANETTKVEFKLHRGGLPITGIVRDAGGGPISGVRVDAMLVTQTTATLSAGPKSLLTASAMTGPDGKYQLTIGEGTVQLTASQEEYSVQRQTVQHAAPGSQADFALVPGAVVEGIVRDRATGQPVVGATVVARRDGQGSMLGGQRGGKHVRSNAAGAFRITGLSPGNHVLTARAAGQRTEQPVAVGLGVAEQLGGIELWLVPATVLRGVVLDEQKHPAANAFVVATSDGAAELETTNEQGEFEFATLRQGSYRVMAHKGGAKSQTQTIALSAAPLAPVTLTLPPSTAVVIRGHVEPRGIATITAERTMAQLTMEPMLLGGALTATSSATGDFELRDVPLGPWNLRAVGADGTRGKTAVEAIAGGVNDVVIKLEPGASIAGRVVDQDGKGVAGATVMAGQTQGSVNHVIRNGVVTSGQQVIADSNGAFLLRGLEPNVYQLSALDRGRPGEFVGAPPKPIKVEQGAAVTGIELKVKRPNGVIRGVVLGPNGAPMAEAWVSARLNMAAMMSQIAGPGAAGPRPAPAGAPGAPAAKDDGDSERSEMIEISDDNDDGITPVLTDAAGKFELRGLPSGQYDLIAEAQAGKLRGRGSSATAGNPVTIKLAGLTELRGVVTTNGKPVSNYTVRIEGPMDSSMEITNASGEYRFIRVDPGTYRVSVTGDAGRGTGEVNVVEGATATLDIKLTSDGFVVGKLVDAAGKAVANAPVLVVAWQPPGTPQQITLSGPPPMSNPDGTFKVSAPAGKSTLLVLGGARTMHSGFTVVSGQTMDVGSIVQGTTTEAK